MRAYDRIKVTNYAPGKTVVGLYNRQIRPEIYSMNMTIRGIDCRYSYLNRVNHDRKRKMLIRGVNDLMEPIIFIETLEVR